MAGSIEVAGEVLTECPVAVGARDSDAVVMARLVTPLTSCGMLGSCRDVELPPRLRSLKRHALGWAEALRPREEV